mgnify:CR=1 FL=1
MGAVGIRVTKKEEVGPAIEKANRTEHNRCAGLPDRL